MSLHIFCIKLRNILPISVLYPPVTIRLELGECRRSGTPTVGKDFSCPALNMGFISSYGSSEPQEDFVEFISIYVTHTAEYWDALVSLANDYGREIIDQKLAIVKDYMKTTWEIDLDELRTVVQRRSQEVLDMDLSTLN